MSSSVIGQLDLLGGHARLQSESDLDIQKVFAIQVDKDIRMQHFELNGGTVLSRNYFYTPNSIQSVFRQL